MADFQALANTLELLYATEVVDAPGIIMITYKDPSGEEQIEYPLQIGDTNGLAPWLQKRLEEMLDARTIVIHPA